MTDAPALPHVEVLRLQPGDVLVVTADRDLTAPEAADLRDHLARAFPGWPVVVVDRQLKLKVARREDGDA